MGYWGEGWGPYLPDWPVQQQLIDLYFKAFPRTLLLMNFDALPALQYGVKLGGGWRLDCWGDMGAPGRNFAHMKDLYPQQLARGGLQDVWQTRPVALETCGVPEQWHQWNYPLKPILDQALRWHASTINIKSSRIPADWKAAFDTFQKQIGYRFVLKKLDYPSHVTRGSMAAVNMWWFNAGVAPVYRSYTLALSIGDTVIALDTDIRRWLPGDAVYENTIAVPRELAPGRYPYGWRCSTRRRDVPPFSWPLRADRRMGGIRSARSSWTDRRWACQPKLTVPAWRAAALDERSPRHRSSRRRAADSEADPPDEGIEVGAAEWRFNR